jgi:hypothetical protein
MARLMAHMYGTRTPDVPDKANIPEIEAEIWRFALIFFLLPFVVFFFFSSLTEPVSWQESSPTFTCLTTEAITWWRYCPFF